LFFIFLYDEETIILVLLESTGTKISTSVFSNMIKGCCFFFIQFWMLKMKLYLCQLEWILFCFVKVFRCTYIIQTFLIVMVAHFFTPQASWPILKMFSSRFSKHLGFWFVHVVMYMLLVNFCDYLKWMSVKWKQLINALSSIINFIYWNA